MKRTLFFFLFALLALQAKADDPAVGNFTSLSSVNSDAGISGSSFVFISDTTRGKTIFDFSELGLKTSFREDWIYNFYGEKEKIDKREGEVDIRLNVNDLMQYDKWFFTIYNGNLNIFMRFYPKTKEANAAMNNRVKDQKIIKKFPAVIDGIKSDVYAVGMESMPTFHFQLVLNHYMVMFTVMNVSADNLPMVQSFISGIQISEEQKKGVPTAGLDIKPLSEQFKIKEFESEELSVFKLKQITKIPTTFKDAGISFLLPEMAYVYCFPEENSISGNQSIVIEGMPDLARGNISVSTFDDDNAGSISVVLSYLNGDLDFETYFETMVGNWKTYNIIKMKRAGFTVVNGQKWGIMEYAQSGQSVLMITSFYKNCVVMVSYSGDNNKYKALTEEMLFSFVFE